VPFILFNIYTERVLTFQQMKNAAVSNARDPEAADAHAQTD